VGIRGEEVKRRKEKRTRKKIGEHLQEL